MQRPWTPDAWTPTIYRTNPAQTPPPHPQLVADHIRHVQSLTQNLSTSPYDPDIWCARAGRLLSLGHPELAVGDAYRALLLCDYSNGHIPDFLSLSSPTGPISSQSPTEPASQHFPSQRLLSASSYRTLVQGLYDCHCHPEALETCQVAQAKFPADPFFQVKTAELSAVMEKKSDHIAMGPESAARQRDKLHDGAVLTIPYPWMEPLPLQRSQALIDSVNKEFQRCTSSCRLDYSSLGEAPIPKWAGRAPQVLGVFAAHEIDPGECILVDRTATAACSSVSACTNCFSNTADPRYDASCCSAHFCSEDCYQTALSTYHKVICGKDFTWLQNTVTGISESAAAMRPVLLCRYLASCVQAGTTLNPLAHPLIARLQPQLSGRHLDVFTLTETVVRPIQILLQLEVDVFANPNFDTWIIHTIWTRLANNKQGFSRGPENGGGWIDSISPLMPFFNHSCDPNVECWHEDTTTMSFFARRHIEEGEELFDSYVSVEEVPLEERQQILWPWFEGPCLCSKCLREYRHAENDTTLNTGSSGLFGSAENRPFGHIQQSTPHAAENIKLCSSLHRSPTANMLSLTRTTTTRAARQLPFPRTLPALRPPATAAAAAIRKASTTTPIKPEQTKDLFTRFAKLDPELYGILTVTLGAVSAFAYYFAGNPTGSSDARSVPAVPGSEPWREAGASGKYMYYPGGDVHRTPKEAPSALNAAVIPGVNLPKELHEKYNKYGKDGYDF
ncbi:uncharacterized protein BKCO1_6500049 [Diplodia corticola]|uniref:SET domain-containing protein n=1 Tax=Diplodia corticola TaxID=236234 RepID=A0A1J9QQ85_9PEZI|nr:uncharacterized protein BKCO1_6500049 [Diplodia corticola]OJD30186.1 hypothetical protein BKCO1_6500049 [Diplodia corticola]